MSAILGISAFYHDSAAAPVVEGEIVAAAQEERFSRKKHDHEFPIQAIDYCLAEGGIEAADLDYVGFYDKPLLKFERLLETYLAFAPSGFPSTGWPLESERTPHGRTVGSRLPKSFRRPAISVPLQSYPHSNI